MAISGRHFLTDIITQDGSKVLSENSFPEYLANLTDEKMAEIWYILFKSLLSKEEYEKCETLLKMNGHNYSKTIAVMKKKFIKIK